ncbi:MAG: CBM35 domain-containing protein [Prevotella sp.]
MSKLRPSSLALLKNKDLIAMNQDALGIGAPVVQREGDVYVVAKDMEQLHGSKRAVVVMNLSDAEQSVRVDLARLELGGKVQVHDCFTGRNQTLKAAKKGAQQLFEVTIPAHGSQAYIMTGTRMAKTCYEAEEAWLHNYQEIKNAQTANYSQSKEASGGAYVYNIGGNLQNYMEWRNVWADHDGTYTMTLRYASKENRSADITVNGVTMNNVAMPKGTSWDSDFRTVDVPVVLKRGFNTISIGQDYGFTPNIDCMELK